MIFAGSSESETAGIGAVAAGRKNTIERPIVRVRRRPSVAEQDQLSSAIQPFPNGCRRVRDLLRLFAGHLRAKLRIFGDLHFDRCRYLLDHACRLLLLLAEKRIKKSRFANIVAQFAPLEEDVYRFPQRVIQDLDHLLMQESIRRHDR